MKIMVPIRKYYDSKNDAIRLTTTMLIITADDYGKTRHATDNILECYARDRITCASAMVFMEDSERAASLAIRHSLEVGLHLNFTLPFNASYIPPKLRAMQNRLVSYLTKHKICQAIYNPLLVNAFAYVFQSQQGEFIRLYGKSPDHYNGHHHMHLCANLLASTLIPKGARVRRTFTFDRGEKNPFNLLYRYIIDMLVSRRFISTASFVSIGPVHDQERIGNIFRRAAKENIEMEVHPEYVNEVAFLLGGEYQHLKDSVYKGGFLDLPPN